MARVIFAALLLLAPATLAEETPEASAQDQGQLQAMVGATWDSRYIWRGFDVFDGKSALHVLADLNLFDTGFGVSAVGHQNLAESFGDYQRWDGTAYYQNGLLDGERLAVNFRVGYVYYYYPKTNSGRTQDLMEGHLILSWPNLLPIQGLQPSYVFVYMLPGMSNPWAEIEDPDFDDNSTGMFHMLMLDYGLTVPAFIPSMDDQTIRLHSELVYNGGVSPFGTEVKSGLSDAVLGVSTDFAFGSERNLVLTPSVYYQWSLERTVNPDNEFWVSLGLKYVF
jgi:hypothetical protein